MTDMENIEPEISEGSPFETLWYRGAAVDKLKMYEDAQERGLLHFSPCKEGTPLWCVVEIGEGDFSVDVIKGPDGKQLLILNDFYVNGFTEQCYGMFEKDWFLTEDEARKAVFSNYVKF